MTVTSAAHAAAPSFPLAAAFRPSDEATGNAAQFANELNGIAIETGAQTAPGIGLAKATVQPALTLPVPPVTSAPTVEQQPTLTALVFSLPRPASPAATMIRPAPAGTPKRTAPKEPATGNPAATAPVLPAPTLEIAPVLLAPPADEDTTNVSDDSAIEVKPPELHAAPEPAPEPPPPAITTSDAPAQAIPEMAFAAKVQPTDSSTHSSLPAEMASASAVASASKKIETPEQNTPAASMEPHTSTPTVTAAVERAAEPAPAPSAHAAPAAHRTEAPTPVSETVLKPSAPLKDISLQVNQPGRERVDVRVVQQGSEVRVSVHSGDAGLNTGLRQGLSELQSRLEETGYRSEMWRPGVATAPVASTVSPQASSNHSRGGDGQPQQQGGSQQESGRRNPNSSNQPRWVEELESSFTAGEKSTGGFYGFSS